MPEFEFRVLCIDGKDSCNFVKSKMKDFKLKSVGKHLPYDHTGTINLGNYTEATKRLISLKKEVGGSIHNISIIEK